MKFKFKSIKDQGGIRNKLDAERLEHNGFGWREFDMFCHLKIPNSIMATIYNVKDARTIKKWKAERQELLSGADAGAITKA